MNFLDMLQEAQEHEQFSSKNDAQKYLDLFLKNKENLNEGDNIELNEFGKTKYKYPQQNKNQVAVIVKKYDEVKIDDDGQTYDCLVALTPAKNEVRIFPMYSKFMKKAKKPQGNVIDTIFKKGK